jgi:glycogen(starch) synthase
LLPVKSTPPRTILMSADTIGGVWSYSISLADEYSRRGRRVVLATMGRRPTEAQRHAVSALSGVDLIESDFRLEWMAESDRDVAAAGDWLRGLERCWQPEVVHLNGYAHAACGFTAPVVVVAHSDVLSWFVAVRRETAPVEWDSYRHHVKRGLEAAALVIAPTRAVLADLGCHYDWSGLGLVIPNGIDSMSFPKRQERDVVLGAGRLWDDAKNLKALDRAASDLPWPVEIAGDANHPDGNIVALSHAVSLGSLDRSALIGRMAEAGIFCAPARYEPFGLAILEAAASGCALVLGDLPSLREVWGDDAVFVDPEDEFVLRRTLMDLIGAPERRRQLGDAARRHAGRYSIDRMAERYLGAFDELRCSAVGDSA